MIIYTIGYSNRSLLEFTRELEKRSITQIVDVRSRPWSRNPSFNRKAIEKWSERLGIHYRFEGTVLGGDGEVRRTEEDVQLAVQKIVSSACNEHVAIMCAEGDPANCHRTWQIAARLIVEHEIDPVSILRDGNEEAASQSLQRVSKRNLPPHASKYLSSQRSLF